MKNKILTWFKSFLKPNKNKVVISSPNLDLLDSDALTELIDRHLEFSARQRRHSLKL